MVILLLQAVFSLAQQDKIIVAFNYLQRGSLDSAKMMIDLAVADTESVNDGEAWNIRGFIYKSIYIKSEKGNRVSPSRIEALNSFKRSYFIDTSKDNIQKNTQNIKYLASTLYNDVAANLDSVHYKIAIDNFEKFRMYYMIVDTSNASFKKRDIEFLKALATVYTNIYDSDKKGKTEFLSLAKEAYQKILVLDPNDYRANFNMGILYYNQAVNLITQSEYDIDIVALNDIQDNSLKLFKEALPFMEKANEIEPKRRETLLGLSGIYFSLNEPENSNKYKEKLKEIGN